MWLTKLQYIFLCCPEISVWQYHPFTLTSAPEEDYISVHIRCVGDFTTALAAAVGCNFGKDNNERPGLGISAVVGLDQKASALDLDPSLKRILPRVFIDGPFGSASEDVFKYEIAVLVGAGIGVTPFASILKSIWYRMNYPSKRTRLRKVYFFWVCRDFGSFEWFKSLLMAIESQDMDSHIEIHTVCLSHHAVPPSPHSTNEINHPPPSLYLVSNSKHQTRRRNKHNDQRRQLRTRHNHRPPRAYEFRPTELGCCIQIDTQDPYPCRSWGFLLWAEAVGQLVACQMQYVLPARL